MTTNKTLFEEISAFCEKHDMSHSGFGRLFLKNPNFVGDLRQPDDVFSPQMKTVNKLRMSMKTYRPKKRK